MNIIETVQSIEKEYGNVLYCPRSDARLQELSSWWDAQSDIASDEELQIKRMLDNRVPLYVISQEFMVDTSEILRLAKLRGWS